MKTCALVIGHGPRVDRGAESTTDPKITELDWNRDLALRIESAMRGNPVVKCIVVHRRIEKIPPYSTVNDINADFTIELHCNAFDGSASGTEMIHYPNSIRGKRLALLLLARVVAVLDLPNRGVKTPWKGRGMTFLEKTDCPAVIAESFFIDSTRDLAIATTKKTELANAYASGLIAYAIES